MEGLLEQLARLISAWEEQMVVMYGMGEETWFNTAGSH
jgi:hypothetical protein